MKEPNDDLLQEYFELALASSTKFADVGWHETVTLWQEGPNNVSADLIE